MYEYQKSTIKEIFKAIKKIEEKTLETYTVEIGVAEDEQWNGNEYITYKGTLLARTNKNCTFAIKEEDSFVDDFVKTIDNSDIDVIDKVTINDDVFITLNHLLDDVLKDNQKREEFHNKLDIKLQALNESLA